MSDDYGPVRIAEDNLGSHFYEPVHEEKTAFEHFLVYEDTAFALSGHHKHYTQQVRGQSGPRSIRNGHYGTVEEGFYDIAFLLGDENVVSPLFEVDPQSPETFRDDAEIVV